MGKTGVRGWCPWLVSSPTTALNMPSSTNNDQSQFRLVSSPAGETPAGEKTPPSKIFTRIRFKIQKPILKLSNIILDAVAGVFTSHYEVHAFRLVKTPAGATRTLNH